MKYFPLLTISTFLLSGFALGQEKTKIGLDPLDYLDEARNIVASKDPAASQKLQIIEGHTKPDDCSVNWRYSFHSGSSNAEIHTIYLTGVEKDGRCERKFISRFEYGPGVSLSGMFSLDPVFSSVRVLEKINIRPQKALEIALDKVKDLKLTYFDIAHYDSKDYFGKPMYKVRGITKCKNKDKLADQDIFINAKTGELNLGKNNCDK